MRTQNGKITKRRRRRRIKPRTKKSVPSIGSAAATRSQAQHRLISLHTSISHSILSVYRRPAPITRETEFNDQTIAESDNRILEREQQCYIWFSFFQREKEQIGCYFFLSSAEEQRDGLKKERTLSYVRNNMFFF